MSKGVNKFIGIGNCCADPDVRYAPSGSAIANVSIACNDSYKDKNTGQTIDKTEFVRVVFFRRLAEIVGEYCKKGSKIYVEGRLQTRKWQDQGGQDRYTTEIVADEMQMLDSKPGAEQSSHQKAKQDGYQPPAGPVPDADFDDDIPF